MLSKMTCCEDCKQAMFECPRHKPQQQEEEKKKKKRRKNKKKKKKKPLEPAAAEKQSEEEEDPSEPLSDVDPEFEEDLKQFSLRCSMLSSARPPG